MSKQPFMSYLETFRLRSGFSKAELAFLLGAMDGKTIRRHERGTRLPRLNTAIGYGLILEASIEQLYEGLAIEVHERVRSHARGLRRRLERCPATLRNKRKIDILARLATERINATRQ